MYDAHDRITPDRDWAHQIAAPCEHLIAARDHVAADHYRGAPASKLGQRHPAEREYLDRMLAYVDERREEYLRYL